MFNVQINDESDPRILRAFAALFSDLAGDADVVKAEKFFADHRQQGLTVTAPQIEPEDSPSSGKEEMTGAEYIAKLDATDTIDAAAVFGKPTIDPAAVFGAPTVPNVLPASDQAAASAPAPVTNGVLLDANGLPWDARINAGTKTQTAAGVWKAKKGVDATLVESVTAELRAILTIPVKPFVPLNAAPPPPPPASASPNVAPPPPPTTVASQDAVTAPKTFVEVCQYVTSRAIAAATILEICAKHGLPGLGKLAIRPDLCDTLYNEFAAL